MKVRHALVALVAAAGALASARADDSSAILGERPDVAAATSAVAVARSALLEWAHASSDPGAARVLANAGALAADAEPDAARRLDLVAPLLAALREQLAPTAASDPDLAKALEGSLVALDVQALSRRSSSVRAPHVGLGEAVAPRSAAASPGAPGRTLTGLLENVFARAVMAPGERAQLASGRIWVDGAACYVRVRELLRLLRANDPALLRLEVAAYALTPGLRGALLRDGPVLSPAVERELAAALARREARLLGSQSLAARDGEATALFLGESRAFPADVAGLGSVAPAYHLGLRARVGAALLPDGRVLVTAAFEDAAPVATSSLAVDLVQASGTAVAPVGRPIVACLAGGDAPVALCVRVRSVRPPRATAPATGGVGAPGSDSARAALEKVDAALAAYARCAPHVLQSYPVRDLFLGASGDTPGEATDEPTDVEIALREGGGPDQVWDAPATFDLFRGAFYAWQRPAVHARISAALAELRKARARGLVLEVTSWTLDEDLLGELEARSQGLLDEDGRAFLDEAVRRGRAARRSHALLATRSGERRRVTVARERLLAEGRSAWVETEKDAFALAATERPDGRIALEGALSCSWRSTRDGGSLDVEEQPFAAEVSSGEVALFGAVSPSGNARAVTVRVRCAPSE